VMMDGENGPRLSDQMKKKEDIEGASQLEAPRQNIQTYLTLEPTVDFENERKLQDLGAGEFQRRNVRT
jgi:hypothetical protein